MIAVDRGRSRKTQVVQISALFCKMSGTESNIVLFWANEPYREGLVLNIHWFRSGSGMSDTVTEVVTSDESALLRVDTVGHVVELALGSGGPNLDPGGTLKDVPSEGM